MEHKQNLIKQNNYNKKEFGYDQSLTLMECAHILCGHLEITKHQALILVSAWYREMVTQGCDDCGRVIATNPSAAWRFDEHQIRCDECAAKLVDVGWNLTEAYYVE